MARKYNYTRYRGGFVPAKPAFPRSYVSKTVGQAFQQRYPGAFSKAKAFYENPVGKWATNAAVSMLANKFRGRNTFAKGADHAARVIPQLTRYIANPHAMKQSLAGLVPQRIVGTGITNSRFSAGKRLYKNSSFAEFLSRSCQKQITHNAVTDRISAGINRQASYLFTPVESPAILGAVGATFLGTGSIDNSTDTAQLRGLYSTNNMYLGRVRGDLSISSISEANIRVMIRQIVAKHDLPQLATPVNPITEWQSGIDNYAKGSSTDYNDPNNQPTQSPFFNAYFAVEKTEEIDLKAGATHVHHYEYNYNCAISLRRLSLTQGLGHITRFILLTVMGTPVNDESVNTNVGLSYATINVVNDTYIDAYTSNKGITVYQDAAVYDTVSIPQIVGDIDVQPETTGLQ